MFWNELKLAFVTSWVPGRAVMRLLLENRAINNIV
jgi:hypothetical protein